MQIFPVDRQWVYTYVLEPYAQGCEYLDLFWKGVDRSLEQNPLSLTERIVYLIEGTALMLPFVNSIIWIALQTFGSPQKLADPFCPEIDEIEEILPPPEIIVHRPDGRIPEGPVEHFGYIETINNNPIRTAWTVETFPDVLVATQNALEFSTSSLYNPNLSLRELHYQYGGKKVDLVRRNMDCAAQVEVSIAEGQNPPVRTYLDLPQDGRPWIQQRAIGFRPFILSNDQELEFYGVVPDYPPLIGWILRWLEPTPFVMKFKLTKLGLEDVDGMGRLLKAELTSMKGWPYNTAKSELWFDPATGHLRKFVDTGTFIPTKTGRIVQNNPLPAPAHP
ncbi:MAG: hypothetical protein K1X28_10060 [Parachlamydiales bacterium]|nr:hypothetical protein [Parachlamydiales bacterium]